MRLLVFFDLPVVTKKDKRAYSTFHKFLHKDGYIMIQYSIYCRICGGFDGVEKHLGRLKSNLPALGSIRVMVVTEKQYSDMMVLLGCKSKQEKTVTMEQLSFF